MELRCQNKKFGEWLPELGAVEVKCSAGHCGAHRGVVVIHRFYLDGRPTETLKFREPPKEVKRT
jgi:hypothetical protein